MVLMKNNNLLFPVIQDPRVEVSYANPVRKY